MASAGVLAPQKGSGAVEDIRLREKTGHDRSYLQLPNEMYLQLPNEVYLQLPKRIDF